MRYHLTPVKMAIINQQTNAGKDVEKRKPYYTVGGSGTGTATVETIMEFPQKIKNGTAF